MADARANGQRKTDEETATERRKRELAAEVRAAVEDHLSLLGLTTDKIRTNGSTLSKDQIRVLHARHRQAQAEQEAVILEQHGERLIEQFASGNDVDPASIEPEVVPVRTGTRDAHLFRLATLLWSVPVSKGYGRRLRFLIRDRHNGKLIGILALGSPVFNLRVRDEWIGWTAEDRETGLVHVMDAFVVGAVPPYSQLIGGKLVASLVASKEVDDAFDAAYGDREGVISGTQIAATLALVTTTSALGRSSLYNRLKLPGIIRFKKLGMTSGYGHFHISPDTFEMMRELLRLSGHKYAEGHQYGDGPNWRFRVVRKSLELAGLSPELLRHGVRREVYAAPLVQNWKQILKGEADEPRVQKRTADQIGAACKARWLVPRSERRPEYREWTREQTWERLCESRQPDFLTAHASP